MAQQLQIHSATPTQLVPLNPYYSGRHYGTTISTGYASLHIPGPGTDINPEDAHDLLVWLSGIQRQLERKRDRKPPALDDATSPPSNTSQGEES